MRKLAPDCHCTHGALVPLISGLLVLAACSAATCQTPATPQGMAPQAQAASPRVRTSLDNDWRFTKGDPSGDLPALLYDVRPQRGRGGMRAGAPAAAPAAAPADAPAAVAKPWILPTGNSFLKNPDDGPKRPEANLGGDVANVAPDFDDAAWEKVDLPHDYAIAGPFSSSGGGGMGRLPSSGVVWYRKSLTIPVSDAGKSVFLDIDGAMSYSEVWCNGLFVGGWPYGYASFRLDLTPYVRPGEKNTLAIRLDNPPSSSRWYPGGGIYRHVWLVKTAPVHVGQWGTYLTTPEVSADSATVDLEVTVDNDSEQDANVIVATQVFQIDDQDRKVGDAVASMASVSLRIGAGKKETAQASAKVANPRLWGTGLHQKPNRYVAVTTVQQDGTTVDSYETPFGIRTLKFDADAGFFLNGEHIKLNGVCNHHDLGALGAAINDRALQRQLEILADMGCNAIRTSHNPPAPELLELADKMGFLVMDEAFDCWQQQKTANDYHLLFDDWHEQELRALLRRDRNHPSVILWSIGNEVGEQGSAQGAAIAKELTAICHEEDPTRITISGMNSASPRSPFIASIDAVGLNYQGAGIFGANPQYPVFHQSLPDKLILGAETASAISSRGVFTFPVTSGSSTPASANAGEDTRNRQVSSYGLYSVPWGHSPDAEFAVMGRYAFVAGEFVWTGFDYLGEPTPFDQSRSSYFGIIDLAGFKKDRFYLYQSNWRPDHPMAHLLPHWTWPDRVGQVTPVHVYTSGDEAELFLNGKSLGRKKKAQFEYRLRWDDVVYEPGELRVVAYKDGERWATESVKTAGDAAGLLLKPDRAVIANDGKDLSFVTLTVADKDSQTVPRSMNLIRFEISGPGEIVATDNGDPTDMTEFPSSDRKAFNGLALVIVRAKRGRSGSIVVTAKSDGLQAGEATVVAE